MNTNIAKYPDRVSVTFSRNGVVDHDIFITVTLDRRLVASLDDPATRFLAREKLKELTDEICK